MVGRVDGDFLITACVVGVMLFAGGAEQVAFADFNAGGRFCYLKHRAEAFVVVGGRVIITLDPYVIADTACGGAAAPVHAVGGYALSVIDIVVSVYIVYRNFFLVRGNGTCCVKAVSVPLALCAACGVIACRNVPCTPIVIVWVEWQFADFLVGTIDALYFTFAMCRTG